MYSESWRNQFFDSSFLELDWPEEDVSLLLFVFLVFSSSVESSLCRVILFPACVTRWVCWTFRPLAIFVLHFLFLFQLRAVCILVTCSFAIRALCVFVGVYTIGQQLAVTGRRDAEAIVAISKSSDSSSALSSSSPSR